MEKTTRRNLLKAAAAGVTATGLGSVLGSDRGIAALGANEQLPGAATEHAHDNNPFTGSRPLAVVSFGQWNGNFDPAVDRGVPPPPPPDRNVHTHLPFEVEVDAGGSVSFVISGLHQILIYANRELEDVQNAADPNADLPQIPLVPQPPPPAPPVNLPKLVNLATGRVYRGLDPRILYYMSPGPGGTMIPNLNLDRVEAVNFSEPGRYLVVCGVRPHFNEGMHGFVNVKA
jgi:plastocyanin